MLTGSGLCGGVKHEINGEFCAVTNCQTEVMIRSQ